MRQGSPIRARNCQLRLEIEGSTDVLSNVESFQVSWDTGRQVLGDLQHPIERYRRGTLSLSINSTSEASVACLRPGYYSAISLNPSFSGASSLYFYGCYVNGRSIKQIDTGRSWVISQTIQISFCDYKGRDQGSSSRTDNKDWEFVP